MTRVAVLGHVEWVEFVRVDRQPDRGGLAEGEPLFEHAGGGAVVAAVVLTRLGAQVDLYTALADDERGRRAHAQLTEWGITVHAGRRPGPTRYVFTTLEDGGERTIVTAGQRHGPAVDDDLALGPLRDADGVYATAADAGLLAEAGAGRAGRRGALVCATRFGDPAPLGDVAGVGVAVYSESDLAETRELSGWARVAGLLVATEGAEGGRWREGEGRARNRGRWPAAPLPGRPRDAYGCGDSFAAGLTFGLAEGADIAGAAAVGARCGAEMLCRVGAP